MFVGCYIEYEVIGQDEDEVYGPGGFALSPQDLTSLGQQLVDQVGSRATDNIRSGKCILYVSSVGVDLFSFCFSFLFSGFHITRVVFLPSGYC